MSPCRLVVRLVEFDVLIDWMDLPLFLFRRFLFHLHIFGVALGLGLSLSSIFLRPALPSLLSQSSLSLSLALSLLLSLSIPLSRTYVMFVVTMADSPAKAQKRRRDDKAIRHSKEGAANGHSSKNALRDARQGVIVFVFVFAFAFVFVFAFIFILSCRVVSFLSVLL